VKIPLLSLSAGLCLLLHLAPAVAAEEKPKAWPAEIERALEHAEGNRAELEKALTAVPPAQRKGMIFLVANMPERDLRALRADFLIENIALAYKARAEFAWGEKIPEDIFHNDVLPYTNVDEARDAWRKELHELCAPLVKDCKTPAEAAQRLNSTIFAKLKVRFSTERKRANQSPKETIEQGKASCTGLSILLIDACRSVAVPARLVGTPLWTNKRGNHNWVEVWDGGWHFAGAAEPDPKGLDRAWFIRIASEAIKDSTDHAIYAASFRRTKVTFPLVWAPDRKDVYAENVTDRYAKAKKPAENRGEKPELSKEQSRRIEEAVRKFFAAGAAERTQWCFDAALDSVLASNDAAVRQIVWKAYQSAPLHDEMKKDFATDQVRYQKYLSAYKARKVGKRPANKGEFPVEMELKKGFGYGGLPDRDKLKEMYAYDRNPVPRHVTWDLTDSVVDHFFWVSVAKPEKDGSIDAKVRDNRIEITTQKVKQFDLDLDCRLIDFGKPLRFVLNDKEQERTARPSLRMLCDSMLQRGDPELACTCHIRLEVEEK
jgi:hypothetical protein